MSGVSTLGAEPTDMLVGTMGLLFPVEGNLVGVNRDVTTLDTDCIIPGCIWGSARTFWMANLNMVLHDGAWGLLKWVH